MRADIPLNYIKLIVALPVAGGHNGTAYPVRENERG
jgi:hypothetical protein